MTTILILLALFLCSILGFVLIAVALVAGQITYVSWKWAREIRKRGYPPCLHEHMTADQLEKLAALRRAREKETLR